MAVLLSSSARLLEDPADPLVKLEFESAVSKREQAAAILVTSEASSGEVVLNRSALALRSIGTVATSGDCPGHSSLTLPPTRVGTGVRA